MKGKNKIPKEENKKNKKKTPRISNPNKASSHELINGLENGVKIPKREQNQIN